ncbi:MULTISPECIES: hypothetical protein [Thermomonosporaceae]|uniref:hypothetical protein n=1 Tax=Thermomonosporaceae TaxID=2012 RepID=UPI00255AA6FD|nr:MULTISPECIES: hypothetical protein [Thermomonosporaceae]MDL4770584.1 hypothetical protein [Actinomadura xylanilytica]
MHQRAINVALTAVTGTCLAGMMAAGVAAASNDSAPEQMKLPAQQQLAAEQSAPKKAPQKGQTAQKKATDKKKTAKSSKAIISGKTKASYFWDDGSGVNGDTGAPAGGKPMQKGLFASPSWPMHTKVKVTANGRSVTGFIGDRGPGTPSHNGVMLDLDTYTFRYLLDGKKPDSKYNAGTGEGHINGVKYEVLKWGSGPGTKGAPKPL